VFWAGIQPKTHPIFFTLQFCKELPITDTDVEIKGMEADTMNGVNSLEMSSLLAARRMMALAHQAELRRKDPHAATKNLKEIFEEDEALLSSGETSQAEGYSRPKPVQDDSTEIRLSDLAARLQEAQNGNGKAANGSTIEIEASQITQVRTELKISYSELPKVDGLVKRSSSLAETDRYSLEFSDPTTFKITDKWSGRSTTIWGDPHVDTNDQEGTSNGEFSDLTGSNTHTTLQLMDGTRVTFTAQDCGVIEAVDIYKGSQHLLGLGSGSGVSAEKYLFSNEVDNSGPSSVPMGDVVRAGGDGNDWFSSSGQMVWGQTTGPVVTARPSYQLELEYRQEIIQKSAVSVRVVNA
jgi:hypothetical protein